MGGTFLNWIIVPLMQWRWGEGPVLREKVQRILRRGMLIFCDQLRILRLIHVNPRDSVKAPDSAYVLVANHPTLIDFVALIASMERAVCVVKRPVLESKMIGNLVRAAGYIDGFNDAETLLREGVTRLSEGYSVMIFPEGTRSPPNGMHPFKRIGFEMASRAKVPVLPVHISCEPPVLMKGSPWYYLPYESIVYRLSSLPPVNVPAGRNHVRSAKDQVRESLWSLRKRKQNECA